MNDSYEGKNGKVKVMYVRSEDSADNKPKNHPAALIMLVVILTVVIVVTINAVITNFLVVMNVVQVSLQDVIHHAVDQAPHVITIVKVVIILHGKRFLVREMSH